FLNGSLTRLVDPDLTLRGKIAEFVERGDFAFASGIGPDGNYERVWFKEILAADEVAFDADVFLLRREVAEAFKSGTPPEHEPVATVPLSVELVTEPGPSPGVEPASGEQTKSLRLVGSVPPEMWNRLGTKILPRLRSGSDLRVGVEFLVTVNAAASNGFISELRQILEELGLSESVRIE
ncbi:MAG TPA: AAA family ATPase, partial [Chloroflexota bacterium]|nr:AAA family ATPase [Chloroflexota bacterium]